MTVKETSYVKVHYTGTLDDGSVFDSSKDRDPLEIILGKGMLIPGFEAGLIGMNSSEKKSVKIESEKAYGPHRAELVQEVPKDKLPQDQELKEGMQLVAQGPHGAMPVQIKEIKGDVVVIDFNHPLAGKDLNFELEVTEEREPTAEDVKKFTPHEHGEGCGCGHEHEHGDKGDCCKADGSDCDCKKEDAEEKPQEPTKEEPKKEE